MNNLSQYHIIGVTGIIGAGKSFVAERIKQQYDANIIELDDIRRDMLWYSLSPEAYNLRKSIIEKFSINSYDAHYFFDRENFTKFIFSDEYMLRQFNLLCVNYFLDNIRKKILPNKLNCVVWVNLIEENYLQLIDYLIFVDISEKQWLQNNQNNFSLIQQRYNKQTHSDNKKKLLNNLTTAYEVYHNE